MLKKRILPIMMFIGLLLGMAYFPYIPMRLFNLPYNDFSTTMKIWYTLFCDIGFMIILFLIYKDKIIKDFKEYFKNFGNNFENSFKYYFVGVVVMLFSNLFIALAFSDATANNEEAVRSLIDTAPLYMLFSVSIYAPFVEEIIFRHGIKDCFKDSDNMILRFSYIIISGFIFALMHILGQTTSYLDYLYIIPYMSLGVAFSSLYSKTDNIFSSISMHSLHNTVTIILYLFVGGVI